MICDSYYHIIIIIVTIVIEKRKGTRNKKKHFVNKIVKRVCRDAMKKIQNKGRDDSHVMLT